MERAIDAEEYSSLAAAANLGLTGDRVRERGLVTDAFSEKLYLRLLQEATALRISSTTTQFLTPSPT